MSEQFEAPRDHGEAPAEGEVGEVDGNTDDVPTTEHTGNQAVDRVLESLEGLDDLPIDDHVAVFERAHENLRGALDGPRPPRP